MSATTSVREAGFLQASSLAFAQLLQAYLECDPAIQGVIRAMAEVVNDPETDEDDRKMAALTLQEALFPSRSPRDGHLGVDLEDDERNAVGEAAETQAAMDREEASFAARVNALLHERGMTQGDLAAAIGVGQPAISMMLARKARPQRRTIEKIAHALEVPEDRLWPGFQ